jgi:hypothetical protein
MKQNSSTNMHRKTIAIVSGITRNGEVWPQKYQFSNW